MIMFHVNLHGCTHYYNIPCEMIRDILCIHSIWIYIYLNVRAKCCHPWVYSFQLKLMQLTCFLSLPALLTWTCAFKAAPLWKKTNHAWCFCVLGGYVAEPCHRDTMESSVDMGWQQTLTPSKGVRISNRKGKRKSPARVLFFEDKICIPIDHRTLSTVQLRETYNPKRSTCHLQRDHF